MKAKLVVVGDSGVGKTCIIEKIKGNDFKEYPTTISTQNSIIHVMVDKTDVEINILDTAGQEAYQSLAPIYARNSDITFLIFDLTKEITMFNLQYWFDMMVDVNADNIVYLVGSKSDLAEKSRDVTPEYARKFIDSLDYDKKIKYCEVSAKTGQNIQELFQSAAKDFIKYGCSEERSQIEVSSILIVGNSKSDTEKKKKCCH